MYYSQAIGWDNPKKYFFLQKTGKGDVFCIFLVLLSLPVSNNFISYITLLGTTAYN